MWRSPWTWIRWIRQRLLPHLPGEDQAALDEPQDSRRALAPHKTRAPAKRPVSPREEAGGLVKELENPDSDPDDSDNSDSDPEPDFRRHPKRWRAWVRRTEELRAFRRIGTSTPVKRQDVKTPDPKVYKGDPDDLNRFLLQVENKFVMEPNRFDTDLIKIRYTGQLLDGKAYKWYQSYHLQISPKDAYRVRGLRALDPKFASWDRFEASLRSSFGERVTRDQAVREWHKLRYTDSVDDFVDEIIRLMWLTDYEGAVVEDKVKHGLSGELRREWAKLAQKPQEIGEQLAILRDMGHVLEDCDRREAKPPGTNSGKRGGQKDAGAGKTGGNSKGAPGKPNAQQKPKQSQKGSEGQKSHDEVLKGISRRSWKSVARQKPASSVAKAHTSGLTVGPRFQ